LIAPIDRPLQQLEQITVEKTANLDAEAGKESRGGGEAGRLIAKDARIEGVERT